MSCRIMMIISFLLVVLPILPATTEASSLSSSRPRPRSQPLRIFLMVGQSNMEGKGSMKHLEELLSHNITKSTYQHYGTPGNYTKRNDVYAYFQDYDLYQGPLTVGYGMPHNLNFGPELEFGWIVGDDYNTNGNMNMNTNINTVVIIKCSWGGKDLAVDFRPPSSGIGNYTKCDEHTKECRPIPSSEYGVYYRKTVDIVRTVVSNILQRSHPHHSTYEIAGLVWFQGWNDVIDPQKVVEYGFNLANFIRDIRSDLLFSTTATATENEHNSFLLPIVVGELGQIRNDRWKEHHVELRHQMRSVLRQPEFANNTRYVMTMPFVNEEGERFNVDCHYYGRADTEFYIGRSFGFAMLQLLEDYTPIVRNINITLTDDVPDNNNNTNTTSKTSKYLLPTKMVK